MATKKLAKQLGSVRKRSQSSTGQKKPPVSNQICSHLIVIDFESTCWREKNNYGPEIIEFPAVLLNTSTGEVESEFHTYVQPQEHPVLSEFCTELTGITQSQVEAGVPLHICLGRFSRWLQALQLQKGVVFPRDQRPGSAPSASKKSCAFLTWSDWDLGVCLQYECKRKQLHKPDVLNSWIDLRATYKSFYNKKPKGLNGALQDLGIQFSGREHSGLDDARNTAQLALRMMQDGCVMKLTRSQERRPLQTTSLFGNANNHVTSKKDNHFKEETVLATAKTSSCKTPESCQHKPCSETHNLVVDTKKTSHSIQELAQDVQSLISPRTLLNGVTTTVYGNGSRRSKAETTTNLSSGMVVNNMSLRNNSKSLILVSTTVDCLPHLPQLIKGSASKERVGLVQQEERAKIVVEMDEGCGSYDAVVLECDDVINNLYTENGIDITNASECGSGCPLIREEPKCSVWSRTKLQSMNYMTRNLGEIKDSKTKKPENPKQEEPKHSVWSRTKLQSMNYMTRNPGEDGLYHFAMPRTFNQNSKSLASISNHITGANGKASSKEESGTSHYESRKVDSSLRPMSSVLDKTNALFMGPISILPHQNLTRTHSEMHKEPVKTSFSIFTDTANHSALSHSSSSCSAYIQPRHAPSSIQTPSALSSLSTNHSAAASTSRRITCKITSPLCACGRRSKRQIVANGGPNHGRGFYCCPVRRSGSGNGIQKGCGFFKWESALIQGNSRNTAASSVSLCFNSSLYRHPPKTSTLRKSY